MLILSDAFWCGGYYFNFDNIAVESAVDDSVEPISADEPILPPSDDRPMEIWVTHTPWGTPMDEWLEIVENYPDDVKAAGGITRNIRERTVETYGGKGSNPDWLGVTRGIVTFGISRSRTIPTIPLTIIFNLEPYMPEEQPQ